MRILCDMDGVIADWAAEYDRLLDAEGPAADDIPRTAMQIDWNLKQGRTPEEQAIIERIMNTPGFYARLKPIRGAMATLRLLLDAGHDVRIVSAPYVTNPTCASDKIDWLLRRYGVKWAQRLILTTDKTLVQGDYLIDDRPSVTGSATPTWRHIIFGDYAYSRHVLGLRAVSWDDVRAFFIVTGAMAA